MDVRELSLIQFRNFVHVENIEMPRQALLVAAAANATGKTNFLESLVVLLRGKSFRASVEECVAWGAEGFSVRGAVENGSDMAQLKVRYERESRMLTITEDGQSVSPITFYSAYPIVLFLPEDTFLFTRGPAQRRNFFNHVLVSQSQYLSALVQYQRVLKQRNAALKTAKNAQDIEPWTQILNEHAQVIWQQRGMLADFLKSHVSEIYVAVTGESLKFDVQFRPGAARPENFRKILDEAWEHERRYAHTLFGPHRDDLEIQVGGRPVSAALSQGQMRGLIIALKVATYRFLKQVTSLRPLVLFDEVLSELDEARVKVLLEHLPKAQIVLTCTEMPKQLATRSDTHLLDLRSIIQETKGKEQENKSQIEIKQEESEKQLVPERV